MDCFVIDWCWLWIDFHWLHYLKRKKKKEEKEKKNKKKNKKEEEEEKKEKRKTFGNKFLQNSTTNTLLVY